VLAYISRRLLLSIVVLGGVTVIVSGALLLSGDPVALILSEGLATREQREELRRELGLDKPFVYQYLDFARGAVQGDMGRSLRYNRSVSAIVGERVEPTLQLSGTAMLLAIVVAVPVGILSAARPNTWMDCAGRALAFFGQSVPLFWLGIMLVLVFSVELRWFPSAGRLQANSLVLPAVTLGLLPMARIARVLRASLLEVLGADYCRTAWSKGLSERRVLVQHAVRNALLPVVTIMGLQFGALLGGAVVTETIFAWPGLGFLSVQAIGARDVPLLRGVVTLVAFLSVLTNLAVDVLYAVLDPRIRYA